MDGRTREECDQLRREAADDDRRAAELVEDNPSYSDYLARRAAWKRQLGNGQNLDE